MNKKLIAAVALAVLLIGGAYSLKGSEGASAFIWNISQGGTWLLPLVVTSSLIDSVNPCAFSILLLTIAFLASIGKLRARILAIGGLYIAGIFLAYLMIGLGLIQALHIFNIPHFMAKVGSILLVALGMVNVINEFFPRFPIKLQIPHAAHRKMAELMERSTLPAAFLLGGLVGLCEFPCTGGPYLAVLGLLHDTATYTVGAGYLILYNLIFVLPLAAILLIAGNASVVEKVQVWQRKERRGMRLWGGAAMVALGIIMWLL